MNIKQVGQRLKELREAANKTQDELAHDLTKKSITTRLSREKINMWEQGERNMKIGDCELLADYFNVTCDYIIRGVAANNVDISSRTCLTQETVSALEKYEADKKALNKAYPPDSLGEREPDESDSEGVYLKTVTAMRDYFINTLIRDSDFINTIAEAIDELALISRMKGKYYKRMVATCKYKAGIAFAKHFERYIDNKQLTNRREEIETIYMLKDTLSRMTITLKTKTNAGGEPNAPQT